MTVCLVALAPFGVLLCTRLRWTALVSWLAGFAAAIAVISLPGRPSGIPDEIIGWLIALIIKFLLVMAVSEAVGASLVRRGGLVPALVGAVVGKAAFIALLVYWNGRHDRLPFDALLFLAALAASGAAGATLGSTLVAKRT